MRDLTLGPPAPLAAVASPRGTGGKGGRAAGAGVGGPGQWLVISGLRGSEVSAPRASARSRLAPSPLPRAARVPPLR